MTKLKSAFQLDYWFYLKVYSSWWISKTRVQASLEWMQLDVMYPRYKTIVSHLVSMYKNAPGLGVRKPETICKYGLIKTETFLILECCKKESYTLFESVQTFWAYKEKIILLPTDVT